MGQVVSERKALTAIKAMRNNFWPLSRLISTNGCFSIMHRGHLDNLRKAKRFGGKLIVFVNSDSSIRKLGLDPIVPAIERAQIVAAFGCVDYVVIMKDTTPERLIRKFKPDIHVKGGDYNANELPECEPVHSYGGMVVTIAHQYKRSTTQIIERIKELEAKKA